MPNTLTLLDKFDLSDGVANTLESYSSLILRWNTRIQMTATRDAEEFVARHVVDSLELVREIPEGPGRMLDVGSGGGLPGLVVAIARPDLSVTLIEPTKKKHAFLSTARRELGLLNVTSYALRDEELLARDDFVAFDYAVARAVWAMETWLERGLSLVRSGGLVLGMEGREETELPDGTHRHRYGLEGDRQRSIITRVAP